MPLPSALDADGFPLLPPLPGRPQRPVVARSLARVVTTLDTAVLTAQTESLVAMVVFVDRTPVDGFVQRGEQRVIGPDALDEIADVRPENVTVTEVEPQLASVLGSYFLPVEIRSLPAGLVVADAMVRSLARPDQRGCVLVRSLDELGLIFLGGGQVLMAYCAGGGVLGGIEQVASLLKDPSATLWARLGRDPGRALPIVPAAGWERPPAADSAPPVPEQPPQPLASAADTDLVRAVLSEVREVLGPHTVRVESVFLETEPTAAGLRAAAESLRHRRFRLLSPATLDVVAGRVLSMLDRIHAG
jgi:hypothetical protein